MDYSKLVETYKNLEETQSTLEKTDIIADLFQENQGNLETLSLFAMGRIFPAWKDLDLGVSSKTVVSIISRATGRPEEEVENAWKEEGDLGNAAEKMVEKKTQERLFSEDLSVERVKQKLEKVAEMEKQGLSQSVNMDKKQKELAELVSASTPIEARYITRTILENLRLGVGEGIIRDALSEAFFEGEYKEDIQKAYDVTNDFSEVAKACRHGIEQVRGLELELGRPVKSMLAKKVETVEEGFETVNRPAIINYKYDGMRAQIHIKDGEVNVFTRRLENVTEQFPDVVKAVRNHVEAKNCILDTEIVGYNPDTDSTIPFQKLSKRIKRKYDIQKMKQEIPVEVRPFDLLYLEQNIIEEPYSSRWEKLESVVDENERSLRLVDWSKTESDEEVLEMHERSLEKGHEGIMMKNIEASYKPGSRVGYMVKLKPVMETLDLAVIGAKWSEGRRSGWLGRLKLGCWNEKKQKYQEIGKLSTGMTDEEFEEITERLKPLIVEENGRDVKLKPEIIIEAEYEEIQKSPNYSSGYALRFPRLKSFRDDKEESDNLEKIERLYQEQ